MDNLTGMVFDIQRGGLYDGPGVRTVVFLKGCPLRCIWCHNPESQQHDPQVSFRPEVCGLCGECTAVCQHGAHRLTSDTHDYDRTHCVVCGQCIENCTFDALQLAGRNMSAEQVMVEIERDRIYYERSGGGLTLTGGEPMSQFAFTSALLQMAQERKIHTCIETCGQASQDHYRQILPLVDLFLIDYKATPSEQHRLLTGVDSHRILANLDQIASSGKSIWLRCPLVPGINDTPEHLAAIADLEARYPTIERIELMAYHNIGNNKYTRYGLTNPLPNLPTTSTAIRQNWLVTLQQLGATRVHLG